MEMKVKRLLLILIVLLIFTGFSKVQAKKDDVIYFNDKNLENAICNNFFIEGPITKEMAHDLSTKDRYIYFSDEVSDLEGLQYFDGLTNVSFYNCNLTNLEILSKLPNLNSLHISDNSIKGKELENIFNSMGKIKKLKYFGCYNNDIQDISFLKNIGNIKKYRKLELSNNKINNISVLKDCNSLYFLNLENNRITDVTPLKNLDCENLYINDNCIINLYPIKSVFNNMFSGRCGDDLTNRYDFYRNPVNFIFKGKEIQFTHITVYYKYQAYAEAISLIKLLGGSAEYNKDTGTLICDIYGNELILKDFSDIYMINGVNKKMNYEMRRMQYDIPYVPVKELCTIFGLNYNILKERTFYTGVGEESFNAPEIVDISKYEISDRNEDYKFIIKDNQVGIITHLGTETNVIIPSQIKGYPVTFIEDRAFTNDINLVSVEIPNTVTRIGTSWGEEGVFSGCEKLISVNINEGKENAYIGSNAFLGCNQLISIKIPGNYKVIYENAFNNCTSLTEVTISEGVERIEAGAFAGAESLVSVTLPSTMKALGYEYDDKITTDPDYLNQTGVFSFCNRLRQVNILEGIEDAYIGAYAFYECPKLESIIIPGNYKSIYKKAFMNCTKLKSVIYEKNSFYDVAYQIIDKSAFNGCIRLEEVVLSESLKIIGDDAFNDCKSLKEIVIPEGVEKIGNFAFSCTSLESVSIPSTVRSIGSSVNKSYEGGTFYGCSKLVDILLKEGNKNATIGVATFQGCSKLEKIIIPGNYITIGEEAFSDCISLKSVIYKNNSNPFIKQKILWYAFKNCKNLVAVTLPSTLTLLEFKSFDLCTKLKTVTIPTGVNKLIIDDFVFTSCPSLTSVYVGENVNCRKYAFSLSDSKASIYTHNEAVKKLALSEELEVYSPASDYVNGNSLFGTIDIMGEKKVGSVLIANIDGVAPIGASISYEWTINNKVISTESTYKININDKGKTIKLTIKGGNGKAGSLTKSIYKVL